jgi:nucleoside-diphosphate-sugar epimerase
MSATQELAAGAATPSLRADVPLVVVGPLTRAGRELAARRGGPVLAVSRGPADDATLASAGADVVDVTGRDLEDRLRGAESVEVAVCALGPVHPGPSDLAADTAGMQRDLAFLERLLHVAADRPVRLVLLSSVVALAPTADRRYYGGFKSLAEQSLLSLLADRPQARLDVLYPGRLVAPADRTRPWHRLHAGFSRLAAHLERCLGDRGRGAGRRRVVGLDARLWLLVRSLSLVVSGSLPGRIDPSTELVGTKENS